MLLGEPKYLEAAAGLGERLCRDAIWSGEECNWLGDFMEFTDSGWQVVNRACGPEVYGGTSGIALFLAYLFSATQDEIVKKTIEGAVVHAFSRLEQYDPVTGFGFYSGLAGIAYVLMEAGEACGDERMLQRGLELLEELDKHEPSPEQTCDVVSGSAGVVPVQLKLQARCGKPFLLEAAIRHGDRILQAAVRSEEGWSWRTIVDPEMKNLTGFSHGVAGIAWALLELYKKCGEQRFLHAAQEGLRYERRWFDPEQENWPDFRVTTESGGPWYAVAWCHGAPGIGLSRLRCFQLLPDDECLRESQAAVRATAKSISEAVASGQGNYSLCHGNCGNAELLVAAADILGDQDSLRTVRQMADGAIEKYHLGRSPWPCGVLNGGENPSLMLGLAGIGHFYLRLYDRKTPSVLLVGPGLAVGN